jgi:hypothetical protein
MFSLKLNKTQISQLNTIWNLEIPICFYVVLLNQYKNPFCTFGYNYPNACENCARYKPANIIHLFDLLRELKERNEYDII